MNNTIHVIGHKHPDSDSICSAMSYAALLRAQGKTAIACRQGPLNEETKFILKRFHQENPLLLTDARATLADIDIDEPTVIQEDETVHHAWHVMLHTQNRSLFVKNKQGKLVGVCTTSDLSRYRIHPDGDLQELMSKATLPAIAHTIGGSIVVNQENFHTNGHVHIITLEGNELAKGYKFHDDIVILSSNEEKQRFVIEMKVACLVITCGQKATEEIKDLAQKNGVALIETEAETMHTARVILESYPVSEVMSKDLITFRVDEYVEDVSAKMAKSRVCSYPVLDLSGNVIGAVSRYHTRNYAKKRFVLVDHSAPNQTINHIDNAYVTAIIDHHHIGGVTTDHPIMYRNMQVGCTCTIVNLLYEEAGITPHPDMAGLMMSAILSDTLNFKSATTTQTDIETVKKLSKIAGISDTNEYAREMLGASVSLTDSTPHEILNRDLKAYQIGKYRFAIGQTNYNRMDEVQKILPAFKANLQKEQGENKLDLLVMLFTEVLGEGSLFVYDGPLSYILSDILETTFDEHSGFDSHIISRKQQLMPKISEILANI